MPATKVKPLQPIRAGGEMTPEEAMAAGKALVAFVARKGQPS